MMGWQEGGVALIVLGALAFLARKFVWTPKPKTGTSAFVPLGSLKKKKDDHCH